MFFGAIGQFSKRTRSRERSGLTTLRQLNLRSVGGPSGNLGDAHHAKMAAEPSCAWNPTASTWMAQTHERTARPVPIKQTQS